MASRVPPITPKPMECLRVLRHLFQDFAVESFRAVEIARWYCSAAALQRRDDLILQCTVCIVDGFRVGTVVGRDRALSRGLEMPLVIPPSSNRSIVERLSDLPATGGSRRFAE